MQPRSVRTCAAANDIPISDHFIPLLTCLSDRAVLEDVSARYIQRAFRGFQGRAQSRRLCVQRAERHRQMLRLKQARIQIIEYMIISPLTFDTVGVGQDKELLLEERLRRFHLMSMLQAYIRCAEWEAHHLTLLDISNLF